MRNDKDFWRHKKLHEMSETEWEALCDGCGKCCLVKLEDEDSGEIFTTSIACTLLDIGACRCLDYENRHARVADCLKLTPANIACLSWLPKTCAYRVLQEGGDLAWWHPLVSGRRETVHEAGISIAGKVTSETDLKQNDFPNFIIDGDDL